MDPNRPSRSSTTSTLGWIGCGCGVLVAIAMASIMGMTWFGYRKGKEIERTFKDPVARTEATRKILPWRELPEGYYAAGAVSIPMLMEMAILSDEEPEPGEAGQGRAFEENGLIFMSFNSWISDEKELLSWLKGETKETPDWIRRSDATLDPEQVLQRGTVQVSGQTIVYAVSRGDAEVNVPEPPEPPSPPEPPQPDESSAGQKVPAEEIPEEPAAPEAPEPPPAEQEETPAEATTDTEAEAEGGEAEPDRSPRDESLMTFFSVDCPGDKRARLGIWFAPDPAPGTPNAEVDLAGTIGDPEKIRKFLGHFELCK
jgi:hypothetical protein